MKRLMHLAACLLLACTPTVQADTADEILAKAEIAGGLILHVGCGEGELSRALYQRENTRVYGLETSARKVQLARQAAYAE
jgi:cyclopropane fatty-acyl-phospholipid synthase-like methyltransferase